MAHTIGTNGEKLAAAFLRSRGCTVVDENAYVGADEIDLIVNHGGSLVAVEVKTATGKRDPLVALDDQKLARFRRAARRFPASISRLDVICIHLGDRGATIRWLRGVR